MHIMQKYYQLSKFPNVLGYIDGTPSKNEHLFVNRMFSFNKSFKGVWRRSQIQKYSRKVAKMIGL